MIPCIKPVYCFPQLFFGECLVMPVAHLLLAERQDDVVFVTMVAHVEDLPKCQAKRWRNNSTQLS